MSDELIIRKATNEDCLKLYFLFKSVVEEQTAYPFSLPFSYADFLNFWNVPPPVWRYCSCLNGIIVGGYLLKPNFIGLGNHIANASFFVAKPYRKRGIGEAMGKHAIENARKQNFQAIQFNYVVSTNYPAINLWLKLGFKIVGTIPKAFRHPIYGCVDVYVMFRELI
ncbi:N-acetyltransferase [Candidatus Methylacidiphilum fumarolicum]|uniref:Acetyltransferase, GNAT family n=2 Tax=Candidatus Methylacidiphilum fumarolicum TaxID=591154 RepID=I0K055_METFB|nr:N-acetyltransferase [Candidatus Methylacidiphilum fumarolicum]MBW6414276.1 GNAT family N-acetyltransferase [Candidatus Methylacidiphilum fumarolicum]TFE70964.1 GNAT family acetyltransferase [Candidatus Methylacidiphilum fumarolicum]TFE71370.1 N-acetyltransferase [Candidatus Methylacidiphilum fumarolicum]TFE74412.1 N-acetyltransferase [Candidatus Methylacidiphilum fumarolicum]TFE76851.1 GNAT family acetyltransferase [Candidatus Methylacidiphilum fumarolicum]